MVEFISNEMHRESLESISVQAAGTYRSSADMVGDPGLNVILTKLKATGLQVTLLVEELRSGSVGAKMVA